jgi:hypothetical protein
VAIKWTIVPSTNSSGGTEHHHITMISPNSAASKQLYHHWQKDWTMVSASAPLEIAPLEVPHTWFLSLEGCQ